MIREFKCWGCGGNQNPCILLFTGGCDYPVQCVMKGEEFESNWIEIDQMKSMEKKNEKGY
jgi:hypothetical protein